jgi:hypothetical protein
MRRFRSTEEGIRIVLPAAEAAFLEQVVPLLEGVGDDPLDPAAARLNPRVFDDDAADREFAMLTEADLDAGRADDRTVFADSLARTPAGTVEPEATGEAWLRVLGEARLTLAARWGVVSDESDWETAAIPHHRAALLDYLGMLQQELVGVMMARLGAA